MAILLAATAAAPVGAATPGGGVLKPPIQGLVDRQATPAGAWSLQQGGPIGAVVVRVPWADLQNPDGSIITPNPIDAALRTVPPELSLKVRLLAGKDAPAWLRRQAGVVRLSDPQSGTASVVRWWAPEVGDAYDTLIAGLAARYDGNPRILDVTVSRCMTFTAEPLLRPLGSATNRKALWAAGLRAGDLTDNDRTCQLQALAAHDAFKLTRSSLALNPYQKLVSPTSSAVDEGYTETLMTSCRSILGDRCVLANNSLRGRSRGATYDQMYRAIQARGAPIAFQTSASTDFRSCRDVVTVLKKAVQYRANSVELPFNYVKRCKPSDLAPSAAALGANPFP